MRHFYFPGMAAFTADVVRACPACQRKMKKAQDQRHTLYPSMSGYPFQKLSLDFVGPLPRTSRGSMYLLTVMDTFTRWLEAFPLRAATAEAVVRTLSTEIFPRFGLCEQLHSDRGSQFTGDLLASVASALSISHTQTPSYNPKSNPVERSHRTLKSALTALSLDQPHQWDKSLPAALFALRTAVCRSTGFAPFQLLFGRDPTTSLDLVFGPPPHQDDTLTAPYAIHIRERIQKAHAWARQNIQAAVRRQRSAYCKDRRRYTAGQRVWLYSPVRQGKGKFATHWTGPWTVADEINDLMVRLSPNSTWVRKSQLEVSIDRLKPFLELDTQVDADIQPDPHANLTMPGDESAEFFLPADDDAEDDAGVDAQFDIPPLPAPPALLAPQPPQPPQQPPPLNQQPQQPPAPPADPRPPPPPHPVPGPVAPRADPALPRRGAGRLDAHMRHVRFRSPSPDEFATPPMSPTGLTPPPMAAPPDYARRRHDGRTPQERARVHREADAAAAARLTQAAERAARMRRRQE